MKNGQKINITNRAEFIEADNTTEIVEHAYNSGLPAAVIIGSGSIRAFPKAMKALDKIIENDPKSSFKVIYGMKSNITDGSDEFQTIILVKNTEGMKNLYRLVGVSQSESSIPLAELIKRRNGLLIGGSEKSEKLAENFECADLPSDGSISRELADIFENVRPIPKGKFLPRLDNSDEKLKQICLEKAREIYGENLPEIVEKRLKAELSAVIGNGYSSVFLAAHRFAELSEARGYILTSRGSVGALLIARLIGISHIDPFSPIYFKEAHFDSDEIKFPEISLNVAPEMRAEILEYAEELFGKENIIGAGVAAKDNRTISRHPAGFFIVPKGYGMTDFTPVEHSENGRLITHFDYRDLRDTLVEINIYTSNIPVIFNRLEKLTRIKYDEIPVTERDVLSLFSSAKELGIEDELIKTGALGIPEFSTEDMQKMLLEEKPTTFSDIVKIAELSHSSENYHFPKAHAVMFAETAVKLAWFKLNYPTLFYAAILADSEEAIERKTALRGRAAVRARLEQLRNSGEKSALCTMLIVYEMLCRDIDFQRVEELMRRWQNT